MGKPRGAARTRPAPRQGATALPLSGALVLCAIVLASGYGYAAYGSELALLAIPASSLIASRRGDPSGPLAALFLLSLFSAGCAVWLHSGLSAPLGIVSYTLLAALAALAALRAPEPVRPSDGRPSGALQVPLWAVLALFAGLAVLLSYKALLSGGIYLYRDEWAVPDLQFFRDYFLQIMKHGSPDFDMQKRMVEGWMHFFIGFDILGRVQFALLAFASLASSFFVFERILGQEAAEGGGAGGAKARLIAAAGAFFYVVNPLDTQIFPSYYPSINYALFPLFFYLLYRAFVRGEARAALLSGLLAGFMFLMVVHTLIYLPIAFLAVGIAAARRRQVPLRALASNLAVFGLASLSAVLFILLPSLSVSAAGTVLTNPNPLNSQMLGLFSAVASMPGPMLMDFHVFWWPYVQYGYPFGGLFYPLSAIFCGALLAYAFRSRGDWAVMSLAALAAVFFLAKGSQPPFGSIYQWLNFSLPLGWLIRVPMKFNHVAPFFFSVLFVLLAERLGRMRGAWLYAALAAAIIFLSVFSWPFFTGDMAGVLAKKDFSWTLQDIRAVNGILAESHPTLISFTTSDAAIDADILPRNTIVEDEARLLNSTGNWSGLTSLAQQLGAQYLLMSAGDGARASGLQASYSGSYYSLFKLKGGPSPFTASRSAYLCYCGVATAVSIMDDPPGAGPAPVLELPYSRPDFPPEYASASDIVVLDSSSRYLPDAGRGVLVPFYQSTVSADTSAGWGRVEMPGDDPLGTEFDLGRHFVASEAPSSGSTVFADGPPILLSGLGFTLGPDSSYRSGSFDLAPPGGAAASSLPLSGPAEYSADISASGEGAGNFSILIAIRDAGGKTVSVVPLLEGSGNGTVERSLNFTVPEGAADSEMYIYYSSPGGYLLGLKNLSIQRLARAPEGPSISSGFAVPESGDYDIYLRLMESRDGGSVGAELDGKALPSIRSDYGGERMAWERLYSGNLSAGTHTLAIVQGGGKNLVNLALVEKAGGGMQDTLANKTIIYRLLGWNDFYSFGGSEGAGGSMSIRNPATSSVYIFSPGTYSVEGDVAGEANLTLDGKPAPPSAYLSRGWHEIAVSPLSHHVTLRSVTLIKQGLAGNPQAPQILGYSRIDASNYNVTVKSDGGPFFLVFGREFSPSWVATVDGDPHEPVSSYGTVNAYLLDFSGTRTVTISFVPQGYLYVGAVLGALGIAVLALYVRRSEKINKLER